MFYVFTACYLFYACYCFYVFYVNQLELPCIVGTLEINNKTYENGAEVIKLEINKTVRN